MKKHLQYVSMLTLSVVSIGTACSATTNGTNITSGSGGNTATGGAGGNTSSGTGFGGTFSTGTFGAGGGDVGSSGGGFGGACASTHNEAKISPLDIYVMFDKSGSMKDDNKWTNCTNAMKSFLQSPEADGISVGLQYFEIQGPQSPACSQCTTCNCLFNCGCSSCFCINNVCSCGGGMSTTTSCDIADYEKPAVEIAPLPGNATALIASINGITPVGGTPTRPALEGAIQHASTWAVNNPTHNVVVVLATDGEPSTGLCSPNTLADVQQVAQAGVNGTPSIKTYVIGVGLQLTSLDAIAASGGTQKAYIVDSGVNTTQAFIDAMNAIRKNAGLSCEYLIPPPMNGETIDYAKVNVQYAPGGGTAENVFHVKDLSLCDPVVGGWYYDNNTAPTKILLCPSTCSTVEKDNIGKIDVLFGCATVELPPK